MQYKEIPSRLNEIGKLIVDSAFRVHKELGPGLLESVYEECMIYDLRENKGLFVETQYEVPINFDGKILNNNLRIDLFVEKSIIVENKAVEKMNKLYEAQLMTYMRLCKIRLGYLINFNVPLIKSGIKRMVM